ncbi:MAG: Ger(x)C family spore germination protein [Bacillota bacterium]
MKKRLNVRRKIAAIILSLIVFLTGCWSNRPLRSLAIVSAVGVDMSGDLLDVSVQLVKASAMGMTEAQGTTQEKAVLNIYLASHSMMYDVRNLFSLVLPKSGYFNHVLLLVISEEVAKQGIADFMDFIDRDHEYDVNQLVVISKGVRASTVLWTDSEAEKIPAKHIAETVRNTKATSQSYEISVYDLLTKINTEGEEATAGVFQFREGSDQSNLMQMDVRGAAVFKGDKLVGWLDPDETVLLNIIQNNPTEVVWDLINPITGKYFNYEFLGHDTSIEPVIKDGKPSIHIKVDTTGGCGINTINGEFPVNGSTVKTMVDAAGASIKKRLEEVIAKVQHEYKSDIFGFGHKIYQTDPAYWDKIKDNWDTIFETLPVEVEVNARITEFSTNLAYERIHIK